MCTFVDNDADDDGDGAGEQVHEVAAGHGTLLADAARGAREQVVNYKQDHSDDGVIQWNTPPKGDVMTP